MGLKGQPRLAALVLGTGMLACTPAPSAITPTAGSPVPLPSATVTIVPSGVRSAAASPSASPARSGTVLEGRVFAPAALANGAAVIVGERFDLSEPSPSPTRAFRVLQASFEKPVQNALVSPRGGDVKLLGNGAGGYTDATGRFRLSGVTGQACVFLDVRIQAAGRTVRLFAWTRPKDAMAEGGVTIDLAATLVARELLRFWQRASYQVTFATLASADVEPLLLRVRRELSRGLPAGLAFDPSSVTLPTGTWSAAADEADGALSLLDALAEREPLVSREIDRLYLAGNALITGKREASAPVVYRPGREPAPSPAPSASADPGASPTVSPTPTAGPT